MHSTRDQLGTFASKALFALSVSCGLISATASAQSEDDLQHARPSLHTEFAGFAPGTIQTLAVRFELDPKWHLYWPGQNDTGYAPSAKLTMPEGFIAGEVQWPATMRRYVAPGEILDHVYEEELVMLIPIKVPESARPGESVTISADLDWLVCSEVCIPGWTTLELTSEIVAPETASTLTPSADLIRAARNQLAIKMNASPVIISVGADDMDISMRGEGATSLTFFPAADGAKVIDPLRSAISQGEELRFSIESFQKPLRGTLRVTRKDAKDLYIQIGERKPNPVFNTNNTDSPTEGKAD